MTTVPSTFAKLVARFYDPQKGEVLIKVAAAGVNGPDLMQRKGLYPAPAGASDLLGLEMAGEVVGVEGEAGLVQRAGNFEL